MCDPPAGYRRVHVPKVASQSLLCMYFGSTFGMDDVDENEDLTDKEKAAVADCLNAVVSLVCFRSVLRDRKVKTPYSNSENGAEYITSLTCSFPHFCCYDMHTACRYGQR